MELDKVIELTKEIVSKPEYFWPVYWKVMEILAITDPDGLKDFIKIIERKLPCEKCTEHLRFKLSEIDRDLPPFEFIITLHNMANILQGKKTYTQLERLKEIFEDSKKDI